MIKTLSPYYVSVPLVNAATSVVCNSCTVKVFIWNGNKSAVPSTAEYEITKINAAASSGTDKINIARIINDFIDFRCDQSQITSLENSNNQVWIKFQCFYDDEPETPRLEFITLAIKGYGYFMEGQNPQIPSNKILLEGDEFKGSRSGTFCLPILLNELTPTIDAVDDEFDIYFQDSFLNVLSNDNLGFTPTIIKEITTDMDSDVGVLSIEGVLIKFTAGTGYTTPQTFSYTIKDNTLNESTATVTLNISDLPIGITAVDDFYTSDGLTSQDLLVLDNDVLGTLPTNITSIDDTGFTIGTIAIDGTNQKLVFTPNGTPGEQTITYTIEDSTVATSTGNVMITIEDLYYFYYEGTVEEVHGLPGNVVYVDVNGDTQIEGDLYLGTCVQIIAKSITSIFRAKTCTP